MAQGPSILPNVALVHDTTARPNFPLIAIPHVHPGGRHHERDSGISRNALIAFASALLGFIRGAASSMVTVGASMFFAEISGSAVADVAAIGSILMPAMKKRGLSCCFRCRSDLFFRHLSGRHSALDPDDPLRRHVQQLGRPSCSSPGIIPGVLGGTGMMAMSYWMARRHGWPVEDVFELAKLWRTFKEAVWALILPVIILGGIFGGLVTATEGGGLAVVAALFIGGLIYRELDWHYLKDAVIEGGIQTAVVMLLVAASALVGVYLTEQQVPQRLAAAILDLTDNRYAVLALLNIFFLVIGLFLHSAAAIILVVPIVMPLINAIGIDPVHFGLVVTLNLGIGQQTPPGGERPDHRLHHRQGQHLGSQQGEYLLHLVLFAVLMMVTYLPMIPMSLVEYFYR